MRTAYGKRKALAKESGICAKHMSDILNRRRRPSPELAAQLERITGIDRRAWLWPDEFENPLLTRKR